jgi:hypothetical protein
MKLVPILLALASPALHSQDVTLNVNPETDENNKTPIGPGPE